MANKLLTEKKELEITVLALREYHDRRYKLYKSNNNMPVTDEEFDELKERATEIREIKVTLDDFEGQLNDIIKAETSNETSNA